MDNKDPADDLIWYLDGSGYLTGKEAQDFLIPFIKDLNVLCHEAETLKERIASELDNIDLSQDMAYEAMELSEHLSHIEICCDMFLEPLAQLWRNYKRSCEYGVYIPIYNNKKKRKKY